MVGDFTFKHNVPWEPNGYPQWPPTVPRPVNPEPGPLWTIEKLKEYLELLKEIRTLEEQLQCPCEPNKADYIGLVQKRIDYLKKQQES